MKGSGVRSGDDIVAGLDSASAVGSGVSSVNYIKGSRLGSGLMGKDINDG